MAEQITSQDQEKHLYLVFDDFHSGYSIRKVSLSSAPSKGAKLLPLPPAFVCLEGPRGYPHIFSSAFGTKIIMMYSSGDYDDSFSPIPCVDVQDVTTTYKIQSNSPAAPFYIPVSEDRLFALDVCKFEVLCKPKFGEPWVWHSLTCHPFRFAHITSYCVQPDPDERIFFSTNGSGTFVFDTKNYVWEKCGDWVFPFTGCGYYDSSLRGFVGLSKEGYLYCCTIASTATGLDTVKVYRPKASDFRVTKRNQADNKKQVVSATLVHMCPGKFCIVESVSIGKRMTAEELHHEISSVVPPGEDPVEYTGGGPQCGRFMYCLKTFYLSYDSKQDLKLKDPKVYRYSLPHEARIGTVHMEPMAFWL